ncbi:unnamed protein product [Prorocentrum cordatum]|uniref:Uncharacterized protein n=1 Tax=Prorocentrum cordatum TaxID=2364126 RepID=A0ABN9Y9N0_9DINO|nr:unnamed protein product [Polarella glacialis]
MGRDAFLKKAVSDVAHWSAEDVSEGGARTLPYGDRTLSYGNTAKAASDNESTHPMIQSRRRRERRGRENRELASPCPCAAIGAKSTLWRLEAFPETEAGGCKFALQKASIRSSGWCRNMDTTKHEAHREYHKSGLP